MMSHLRMMGTEVATLLKSNSPAYKRSFKKGIAIGAGAIVVGSIGEAFVHNWIEQYELTPERKQEVENALKDLYAQKILTSSPKTIKLVKSDRFDPFNKSYDAPWNTSGIMSPYLMVPAHRSPSDRFFLLHHVSYINDSLSLKKLIGASVIFSLMPTIRWGLVAASSFAGFKSYRDVKRADAFAAKHCSLDEIRAARIKLAEQRIVPIPTLIALVDCVKSVRRKIRSRELLEIYNERELVTKDV